MYDEQHSNTASMLLTSYQAAKTLLNGIFHAFISRVQLKLYKFNDEYLCNGK